MPGLLLCFVMRYDAYKKSQLLHFGETGVPPPRHLGRIRQEKKLYKITQFVNVIHLSFVVTSTAH